MLQWDSDDESVGNMTRVSDDDPAMMLRSWIDTHEEAVTNHYSQELRSKLERIKVPATSRVKPKDVMGDRCNVSLRGNGMKVLTANSHIPANTPITECRGKYMLSSQYRDSDGEIKSPVNMPFVLIHRLCPDLEVCVDSKTYGNNSRFCRRSNQTSPVASHNAEVRHHLDKGSLHLYIVSCCIIEKNQEILLPPEPKNSFLPPLSISDELREINKANGLPPDDSGGGPGGGERQPRKSAGGKTGVKRRLKREAKKFAPPPTSSSDEERESTPPSPRKTRLRKERSAEAVAVNPYYMPEGSTNPNNRQNSPPHAQTSENGNQTCSSNQNWTNKKVKVTFEMEEDTWFKTLEMAPKVMEMAYKFMDCEVRYTKQ